MKNYGRHKLKGEMHVSFNARDYIASFPAELQEKAAACKTAQELLDLASENDLELPPEALTLVAGGCGGHKHYWHKTQSDSVWVPPEPNPMYTWMEETCQDCKKTQYTLITRVTGYTEYIDITYEQFVARWKPE